jgi:tetratricopeptide (TPR) repeat protein
MHYCQRTQGWLPSGFLRAWRYYAVALWLALTIAASAATTNAVLLELEGQVQVARADSQAWQSASTNQVLRPRDQVRTLERSRAVVRLSNLSTVRLGPLSMVRIPEERSGISLLRGLLYYFHRDKPGAFPVQMPSAYAVILGTEFTVEVAENGTTRLTLIDGSVEMTNQFGRVTLTNGEAALAEPNAAPRKTPAVEAVNVIQWVLYYPGVLDLEELQFTPAEQQALEQSIAAYRSGDLLAALSSYPAGRQAASDAERVYRAGLLLSVGEVEAASELLSQVQSALSPLRGGGERSASPAILRDALRTVIAAVKFQSAFPLAGGKEGQTSATVLLAESYHAQSQAKLERALELARAAVRISPRFGFALARVAELEFSFGRTTAAREALEKSLALAPRNAQAVALKGFLFAADNRIDEAVASFNEAIVLDGALGNAWLGRGLCRIRHGDAEGGRVDLQTAATLEPQRAILRSYLGKAFNNEGDWKRGRNEIERAQSLDPNDPTAWLYSALLNREANRINQGIRDLEYAENLNENRRVFRSGLLIEKDRAVQGVNLAGIYEDAGMLDVSAREAGRAVESDPANYSAHLFLGDTYQRLRDPTRVNQRFETPAVTEYLLANLLSPVGAGTLAQSVSQNEYSKLFERDGIGASSLTEYYSRGAWLQSAAQYGTFRDFSYAVSAFYNSDNGQRANNDLEQHEFSGQLKYQITPTDSVYVRVIQGEIEGGDLSARQQPAFASRSFRFEERQEPLLLAGYHREWAPGVHTLALMGWVRDELQLTNGQQQTLLLGKDDEGRVTDVVPIAMEENYQTKVGFFTSELQQLWQTEQHTVILGGRYQAAEFDTRVQQSDAKIPPPVPGFVAGFFPKDKQSVESQLERASGYGYYHWRPVRPLLLVAGVSYDWLKTPMNFRYAPVTEGEMERDQISPKGGVIWTPTDSTTLRAAYSQSLGGAGFDQSFRLEPSQVAGFNQSFRSVMPESLTGANTAEKMETVSASIEKRIGRSTYLALSGEWLQSDVDRDFGVYDYAHFTVHRSSTRQHFDFDERTLVFTANQLVSDEWAFGVRYRVSRAELQTDYRNIPDGVLTLLNFKPRTTTEAVLHQVNLTAIYNHRLGFFGQFEALWNAQMNEGDSAGADEDFWQLNAFAGWRGFERRLEVRVGILNITGQDYRLSPLNLTAELPRERMFVARFKWNF